MMPTLNASRPLNLKDHAAAALRRARRLPMGPARNDLRQLAIGLRSLERRNRQLAETFVVDVPVGEAPLAPL